MVTSKIRRFILVHGFRLLYHDLAWSYDWVASIASAGNWEEWIFTAIPHLAGPKILELGFGPGHLQSKMLGEVEIFGIDESGQMCSLASRNIIKASRRSTLQNHSPQIARGKVQDLPFSNGSFNTVVSTFPSPYIFDPQSLSEVIRILKPGGRFVVVLGAEITGKRIRERIASWLMAITQQAYDGSGIVQFPAFGNGITFEPIECHLASSRVILELAIKPDKNYL